MNNRTVLSLNPELQRQLWLEFSPSRLAIMPLLLGSLFVVRYLVGDVAGVTTAAEIALAALLILWGSRLAADSFVEEVTSRTWDIQRLSIANPWSLTLGKLLGGTAYAWYGAAICIAVDIALDPDRALSDLPTILVAGLLAQAGALFGALVLHQGGRREHGRMGLAQLFGLLFAFTAGSSLMPSFIHVPGPIVANAPDPNVAATTPLVHWYGMDFATMDFKLVLWFLLVLWLWAGVASLIRGELGGRSGPLAWTLFTVYCCVVAIGFEGRTFHLNLILPHWLETSIVALTVCYVTAVMLSYIALLATPLSILDIMRLRLAMRQKAWPLAVWHELPPWVPSAAVALAASLPLTYIIVSPLHTLGANYDRLFFLGWFGNFLRDILLICWVRLQFGRRNVLVLITLFGALYEVVPFILRHAGSDAWAQILVPGPPWNLVGLVGPWILAAISFAVLYPWLTSPGQPSIATRPQK